MLNVHVYPSPFEYETRILKVTKSLVEAGLVSRVLVIAKAAPGLPERAEIDAQREVLRVPTGGRSDHFWTKVLGFVSWTLRVLWVLRREPVGMVNCHSLSVLPLCVVLARLHGALLVYEPHELETETATFTGWRKTVGKWVERRLIGFAVKVIVVSESIAEHYRRDYGLDDVPVIMNVPVLDADAQIAANRSLRDHFKIPDGDLIFMYQGALEEERGTLELLNAFMDAGADKHLVFMGFGSLEARIDEVAQTHANVHRYPAVPPGQVINFTRGADVGFALLDSDCENHRCALPNKLFHYLHAGLPVIVSDLPEMGRIVDHYACGWRVENTPGSILARVEALTLADIETARAGARRARTELHWAREAAYLEQIYRRLLDLPVTA